MALKQLEDWYNSATPEERRLWEQELRRRREAKGESAAGRPSKYRPEMADKAAQLARLGATDEEMMEYLGIAKDTFYQWRAKFPEFSDAVKLNKEAADDRVEESLFKQATTGNVTAAIFWLKNRRGADWRDRRELSVQDHRSEQDIEKALADMLERKFLDAKAVN